VNFGVVIASQTALAMTGFNSINTMNKFKISGELSFTTVPTINKSGLDFIKQTNNPAFDLNQVSFSDNSGVALLISWRRYAKKLNKQVTFINVPKQLVALVMASGLKEILT
jgi:phospholipid transport system transporter-binding protein